MNARRRQEKTNGWLVLGDDLQRRGDCKPRMEGQKHTQACRTQQRTEGAVAETLALTLASSLHPSPKQVSLGG